VSESQENNVQPADFSSENYEYMLNVATDQYTEGNYVEVRRILTGLETANGADPRIYKLRGSCFLLEGNSEDAEKAYEMAYSIEPDDMYTLVALGEMRLQSLQLEAAAPFFERLFALDPEGQHPAANRGRQLVQDFHSKFSGSK